MVNGSRGSSEGVVVAIKVGTVDDRNQNNPKQSLVSQRLIVRLSQLRAYRCAQMWNRRRAGDGEGSGVGIMGSPSDMEGSMQE